MKAHTYYLKRRGKCGAFSWLDPTLCSILLRIIVVLKLCLVQNTACVGGIGLRVLVEADSSFVMSGILKKE